MLRFVTVFAPCCIAILTSSLLVAQTIPGGGGPGGSLPTTTTEIRNDGAGKCVFAVDGNEMCPPEQSAEDLTEWGWSTACNFGTLCAQPPGEINFVCGGNNGPATHQYRFLNGGAATQVPLFRIGDNPAEVEDEAPLELLDLIACYSKKECLCLANEVGQLECTAGNTVVNQLARYEINEGAPCPQAIPETAE